MNKPAYTPISCSYHDNLEGIATTRARCKIVYREAATGEPSEFIGRIVDIYARDKEEFMVMDNGLTIRLDHLASINGIVNPSFAFKQEDN